MMLNFIMHEYQATVEKIVSSFFYQYSDVTLWHNGSTIFNHSLVITDEFRKDIDLFCVTNYDVGSSGVGSWYFPNETEVPQSETGLSQYRGRSYVALTHTNSLTPPPSGLYRCVIPDSSGVNMTLFAGIYQGILSLG